MKDIYLMNKETGEIEASEKVFKEFYKTHKIFDSVFDEWIETNLEVENSEITNPLQQILNCIIAEWEGESPCNAVRQTVTNPTTNSRII